MPIVKGTKSRFFTRFERCSSRSRAASASFFLAATTALMILQEIDAALFAGASVPLLVMARGALVAQRGVAARAKPGDVASLGAAFRAVHSSILRSDDVDAAGRWRSMRSRVNSRCLRAAGALAESTYQGGRKRIFGEYPVERSLRRRIFATDLPGAPARPLPSPRGGREQAHHVAEPLLAIGLGDADHGAQRVRVGIVARIGRAGHQHDGNGLQSRRAFHKRA